MSLVYHLTEAGKDAVSNGGQVNLPLEYRRLLGLIEVEGHVDVIRGRLRRFPDRLIEEWLKELVDLNMIDAGPGAELEDFTFSGQRVPLLPLLSDEDDRRLAHTAVIAGATLLRSGTFVADERIANLPALAKAPADTVILLVEDDPDQAELAQLRLTLAGYQVRTADCAKALSRALREHARPDLVLLDIVLPDRSGFAILGQLRGRPEFATLPIVMLSAKTELADIRKGLALGADGYITKPYSSKQLAEVIARVLKHTL